MATGAEEGRAEENGAEENGAEFGGTRLVPLWGVEDAPLRAKVLDLWARWTALPPGTDPAQRVRECVLVALGESDTAIGVATAFPGYLPPEIGAEDARCYYYRLFIAPSGRRPHLMRAMTTTAFDILKSGRPPDGPGCFAFLSDNPGLTGRGMTRLLVRHGYRPMLRYPNGKILVLKPFGD